MKIMSSSIHMASESCLSKSQLSVETLEVWNGNMQSTNSDSFPEVVVELSDMGKALAESINQSNAPEESIFQLSAEDEGKLKLISEMIYYLTGKRIKFQIPKLHKINSSDITGIQSTISPGRMPEWGISYQSSQFTHEEEHLSFQTKGIVKTQDGREINIDLKLNMSRSFTSYTNFSFQAGSAPVDPLVINLNGTGASLSSKSYEFDLNFDGKMDKIAFLNQGSGFLALDKNSNGVIDDGRELFGPSSGDGFLELMAYDDDQNEWIDENDDIYKNLSIWMRNDEGEPVLLALGQAGIGAIYLGHVDSPYSLVNNNNETLGLIQKSGIFLFENGQAGTIQHVDLPI